MSDTLHPENNVWLAFESPEDESATWEANTYRDEDGIYVGWYHVAVGLVKRERFDSLGAAERWLLESGYQDFSS